MKIYKSIWIVGLATGWLSQNVVEAQTQNNPLIINISPSNGGERVDMGVWYLGRLANISRERDFIGAENVTGLRIRAPKDHDLVQVDNRLELTQVQRDEIEQDLAKTDNLNGTETQISIMSSGDGLSPFYTTNNGNSIRSRAWKALFKRTIEYVESRGFTVGYIEPLNEPANKTGSAQNWSNILADFQEDSLLTRYPIVGPSTYGFRNAEANWWNVMGSQVDWGATHVIGSRGTGRQLKSFIRAVRRSGKEYFNSEIHSLVEVIISANMGSIGGEWWPRQLNEIKGNFVKSLMTERWINRSYVEKTDSTNNYAAGVAFRVPNQERINIFAESRNGTTYFRIVSDQDVSFNDGPLVRSFEFVARHNEEQQIVATW